MNDFTLTVCGLQELDDHGDRDVTHVLSILDPGTPEPAALLVSVGTLRGQTFAWRARHPLVNEADLATAEHSSAPPR